LAGSGETAARVKVRSWRTKEVPAEISELFGQMTGSTKSGQE
jgi:hypothetical protein